MKRDVSQIAPLFIVGSPRSGTTVVMRAIETLQGYYSPHVEGHCMPWLLEGVDGVIADSQQHCQAFLPTSICTGENFDKLLAWLARAIDGFMREVAGVPERYDGHWIDKTPDIGQLRRLPLLQRIFPNCKAILTYRHPRDVVISTRNVWNPPNSDTELLRRWTELHREYRTEIRPLLDCKRILEIKQESIVAEPDIVGKRIGEFLDLSHECHIGLANFFKQKRINRRGGVSNMDFTYLEQADAQFIKLVDAICGREMCYWGYASATQTLSLPPSDMKRDVPGRTKLKRIVTLLALSIKHPPLLRESLSEILNLVKRNVHENRH